MGQVGMSRFPTGAGIHFKQEDSALPAGQGDWREQWEVLGIRTVGGTAGLPVEQKGPGAADRGNGANPSSNRVPSGRRTTGMDSTSGPPPCRDRRPYNSLGSF